MSDPEYVLKTHLSRLFRRILPNHPLDTVESITQDTLTFLRQPFTQQDNTAIGASNINSSIIGRNGSSSMITSSPYTPRPTRTTSGNSSNSNIRTTMGTTFNSVQELIQFYKPLITPTKHADLIQVLTDLDSLKLNEDQLLGYLNTKLNLRTSTQQSQMLSVPLFEVAERYKNELFANSSADVRGFGVGGGSDGSGSLGGGEVPISEADVVRCVISALNGLSSDLFPVELRNFSESDFESSDNYDTIVDADGIKRKRKHQQQQPPHSNQANRASSGLFMSKQTVFKVPSNIGLGFGELGLVYELLELGLTHMTLLNFKKSVERNNRTASRRNGQLEVTILSYLNRELLDYANQINSIKNVVSLRLLHYELLNTLLKFRFLKFLILDKLMSVESDVEFIDIAYEYATYYAPNTIIHGVSTGVFNILLNSYLRTVNEKKTTMS
ncbi:unnamed protein product [Ambrosiozyma monospora]|uniref:Unnamed protein product n=1 Tax=Ambrosiozyma monospora TaxID=43982 RepID=A0ACB5T9P6_AMBMO|nr:unnamed protein product [Ambrosiozyma monospora]